MWSVHNCYDARSVPPLYDKKALIDILSMQSRNQGIWRKFVVYRACVEAHFPLFQLQTWRGSHIGTAISSSRFRVQISFSCGVIPMETDLIDKMPCHNQQLNNTESPEHAGKHVRFARSNSSSVAESCPDDKGPCQNQILSDIQRQIGPQLKLLPLNDQIRELQTIIRDKWVSPFKPDLHIVVYIQATCVIQIKHYVY